MGNTRKIASSRRRTGHAPRALITVLALCWMFCFTMPAWAACSGEAAISTISLPDGLQFSRDQNAAIGTVLWQSGWVGQQTAHIRGCEPASEQRTWRYAQAMTPVSPAGTYATNVPGIGVQVAWINSFEQSPAFAASPSRLVTWPATTRALEAASQFEVPTRFFLRLVKTGPIGVGMLDLPVLLAQVHYGNALVSELQVLGRPQVRIAACTTPDVLVDLGRHNVDQLAAAGSSTPPVDFQLALHHCPLGMAGIRYMFASREAQAQPGVIAGRQPESSSRGAGVRITNRQGQAVPLTTLLNTLVLPGGEPATQIPLGGEFIVPLRAALYRLDAQPLLAGSLHAEAEFTMWYE